MQQRISWTREPLARACSSNAPAKTVVIDKRSWRDFAPATILLFVSAVGLFLAVLSSSGSGGQYAVVAPPWYGLTKTTGLVATAGGEIIDLGGLANVVIAHSVNPGFADALYRAGAWLVINPVRLRGCLGFKRDRAAAPGSV